MARRKLAPDDILAGHAPAVAALAERLRSIVKAAIPEADEVAYPVWHAIAYRHPEAGYVCGIFPYEDHLKVYFEYGRFLPDPDGILTGDGKQTRYVLIRTAKDVKILPLRGLVKAGIEFKRTPPKRR